jgi:hypothetical protein
MTRECYLPFPRGTFYCDDQLTPDSSIYKHLLGQEFTVPNTQHSDGTWVKLRVVCNASGGDITVARKLYKFGTGSQDLGRAIGGVNDSAGGLAVPLDDAYTVGKTWSEHDLAYVVIEGWCNSTTEASSVNLAAHAAIASDASGLVNGAAAAAGETVLGTIDQASTTTSAAVRCWFDISLKASEAAG